MLFTIELYDKLDSTNSFAKRRILKGEALSFCAILCRDQTKGRGTKDRTWVSMEGNVFLSVVLPIAPKIYNTASVKNARPLLLSSEFFERSYANKSGVYFGAYQPSCTGSINRQADFDELRRQSTETSECLSLCAGLAVARAVKWACPNAFVSVKYPNDILIDGLKVSGILIEIAENLIIVGVGLNLAASPTFATYLQKYTVGLDYWSVVYVTLHEIEQSFGQLVDIGLPYVKEQLTHFAGNP
jgi:hypothetical protein